MEDFDRAINDGDIDYLNAYLHDNKISKDDMINILSLSVCNGHLHVVKYLVQVHKANIHSNNEYALRYAAENGHINVVKYLVEKGADIHANNEYALRWSAQSGHIDVVKYLVEKCADIHADDEFALRWSAQCGHIDVVKYLVEKGADIHADNEFALRWSAHNGHIDVVKYLVEKGADIHAGDEFALRWSARNGHINVVKYLVKILGTIPEDFKWCELVYNYEFAKYFLSIGIPIDKLGTRGFNECIVENLANDAEYIAQYLPKQVPEGLVPKEFHEYALKYGIVYQGSNYPPMEEEYKKRKEIRSKLKKEIYEKAQEILYRPGGIRFLLMEERFYENAFMKKRASSYAE